MDKECYIICGGPETCNSVSIPSDAYVICADSGYDKALAAGIIPDLILGDFDSIKSILPENCEVMKAPSQKDDTDTMLAVKIAMKRGYRNIILVSALEGRTDHSIANIATLFYIKNNNCNGRIIGDNNSAYYLISSSLILECDNERYFSVFAVSENATVTITGAKYSLENHILTKSFPLGVSNEFSDNECKVTVHDGEVIILTVKK